MMDAAGGRAAGAGRRGAEQGGEAGCGGAGGGGKSRAASAARGGGRRGRLVAGHCGGDGGRDGRRPAIDAEPEEPRRPTVAYWSALRLLGQCLIIYFIGQFRPRGNPAKATSSSPSHASSRAGFSPSPARPTAAAVRQAARRGEASEHAATLEAVVHVLLALVVLGVPDAAVERGRRRGDPRHLLHDLLLQRTHDVARRPAHTVRAHRPVSARARARRYQEERTRAAGAGRTERETTDRQTDRQTDRHTDTQTHRQRVSTRRLG